MKVHIHPNNCVTFSMQI